MPTLLVVLFVLVFAPPVVGAEIPAQSRVDAVTVFPASAEVRRVATVRLNGRAHRDLR